jgi:hypothetical protein
MLVVVSVALAAGNSRTLVMAPNRLCVSPSMPSVK